ATDEDQLDKCSDESDYLPQKKPKPSPNKATTPKPEGKKKGPKRRITADGHVAKKPGRKPRAASIAEEKRKR
ncbi:hypothetical protein OESDEN_01033, partial [Oesophagostomum dentatum]